MLFTPLSLRPSWSPELPEVPAGSRGYAQRVSEGCQCGPVASVWARLRETCQGEWAPGPGQVREAGVGSWRREPQDRAGAVAFRGECSTWAQPQEEPGKGCLTCAASQSQRPGRPVTLGTEQDADGVRAQGADRECHALAPSSLGLLPSSNPTMGAPGEGTGAPRAQHWFSRMKVWWQQPHNESSSGRKCPPRERSRRPARAINKPETPQEGEGSLFWGSRSSCWWNCGGGQSPFSDKEGP